jgi:hypothetical protein
MRKWIFLGIACVVVGGLLLALGAPWKAVVTGVLIGIVTVWRTERHLNRSAR